MKQWKPGMKQWECTYMFRVTKLNCCSCCGTLVKSLNKNKDTYLIKCFASNIDPINFKNFIINGQQSSTFGEATRHQSWNKHPGNFFQPHRCYANTRSVTYVKSEGSIGAILHQSDTSLRWREYVDVNNRWHSPEVLGFSNGKTLNELRSTSHVFLLYNSMIRAPGNSINNVINALACKCTQETTY